MGLGDSEPFGDLFSSDAADGGWAGYSSTPWVKYEIPACMNPDKFLNIHR